VRLFLRLVAPRGVRLFLHTEFRCSPHFANLLEWLVFIRCSGRVPIFTPGERLTAKEAKFAEDPMKISITHGDIASGCRFNPDLCPVAQALCRAGIDHFGVFGVAFLSAEDPHAPCLLPLPFAVAQWIARFDAGHTVGPMSFELKGGHEAASSNCLSAASS
jgi:hypothetical protein